MHRTTTPHASHLRTALRGLAFCAALFMALPTCVSPARAEGPIPIKLATLAPEGTTWIKIMRSSMKEIEQKLNGRIKVTIYGGGVQGDEKVAVQKMKTEQLQGAALSVVGLSEIAPEFTVFNLPMVFSRSEQVVATRRAMQEQFSEKLWERGYKLASWGDAGFLYLYSAKPIQAPEDLKSGKVWVWSSDPVFNEMVLEAGAAPIPLGIPDVLYALNTGQVDTVLMNPIALVSLQWFTKMKYQFSEPIVFSIGGLVIARDVWEKLTPEEQAVFDSVYAKWMRVMDKKGERDNARALTLLQSQGIELVTPNEAEMVAWNELAKRTWERLAGRAYPEELLREMLRHRDGASIEEEGSSSTEDSASPSTP